MSCAHITELRLIFMLLYAGESGVVYCGYLDSGGGSDMVAIKTCKGKSIISIFLA